MPSSLQSLPLNVLYCLLSEVYLIKFVKVKSCLQMLQTRSTWPCSLCLVRLNEASRNHRKGLGMSKWGHTHQLSHIGDRINLENYKQHRRCCVYWKEKEQAMCKYDFCYDALSKGSWEQKVWLNHTSFPITSTPIASPIPCLCWHLTPVVCLSGLPMTYLLNPAPLGCQTVCSSCDDYCFPAV